VAFEDPAVRDLNHPVEEALKIRMAGSEVVT
jgi:hypothetical protein